MRSFVGLMALAGIGFSAAALMPTRPALAWGPEAHRTIALIADDVLHKSDPAAQGKLTALLATDKSERLTKTDMASEATWADVLRDKSPEARTATSAWHATRLKPDNPDLAAACFNHKPLPAGYPASHGPQDNCSVDKVVQFAAELQNPGTSPHERLAALQFLLNLVGDLNDPLLAIDHGDQGGACTALQVGGKPPVRLAAYWEETLVREVVGSNPASGGARILASVPAAQAPKWIEGTPQDWLRDTYEVAKNIVYAFPAGQAPEKYKFPAAKGEAGGCPEAPLYKVGAEYETKALAATKEQLAKAGLRLARILREDLK